MTFFKILFSGLLVLQVLPVGAMYQWQPVSVQRPQFILRTPPLEYANKPIIWLEPLLPQVDGFSCGDRAIFHAMGLYAALKTTATIDAFVAELYTYWSSQRLLFDIGQKVARFLPRREPLNSTALSRVLAQDFPQIAPRTILLSRYLQFIGVPGQPIDATTSYLVALDRVLYAPREAAFVICDVGGHVVLCALVTDAYKKACLYVVDSLANANQNAVRPFLAPLLAVVETHNANIQSRLQ